jgi:hypothetical protein
VGREEGQRHDQVRLRLPPIASFGDITLPKPSIKGSAITGTVEDVRKLVQSGAISEKELEKRLTGGALALIRQPIAASQWYDIRAVASVVELLWDVEGHRDPAYMRRRGEEISERLLQAGLYTQLDFVKRSKLDQETDPKALFEAFGRDLRLMNTLSGSMLNFGRWTSRPDPEYEGRYIVEIHDAAALPVATSLATEGFMNRILKEMRLAARWCLERPRPDLVVYRMDRPLSVGAPSESAMDASFAPSHHRERGDAVDVAQVPEAQNPAAPPTSATAHGIKGSLFQGIVSEVKRLITEGQIRTADLALLLTAEDQEFLSQAVLPGSWYPIATHDRMLKLLAHKQAPGGEATYWIEGGRQAADQLAALGIYRQFEQHSKGLEDFVGRILVTLSGAVYNFTSWKWCGASTDHISFTIEVSDATHFPETCRLRAQGFIERAASRAMRTEWCVTSRRILSDKIVFEGELKSPATKS